jgi:hypothetical protein
VFLLDFIVDFLEGVYKRLFVSNYISLESAGSASLPYPKLAVVGISVTPD